MGVSEKRKLRTFSTINIEHIFPIVAISFVCFLALLVYVQKMIFTENNLLDIAYNGWIFNKPVWERHPIGFADDKNKIYYIFNHTDKSKFSEISFFLYPLDSYVYDAYTIFKEQTPEEIEKFENANKGFFKGETSLKDKAKVISEITIAQILQKRFNEIAIYYYIAFIFLLPLVAFRFRKRYIPCPHCGKSVKVKEKWKCDSCYHTQSKERYIYRACEECKAHIKEVYCEHCHKELEV